MEFLFVKGALIGFSIAAPVGPIGTLCIIRSVMDGPRIGLVTGLGAATADAVYGVIAALGLTAISSFLVGYQFWFGLLGGLFLVTLAYKTFNSRPAKQRELGVSASLKNAYLTTFVLTIANPMTILSFIAVFAGLGVAAEGKDYVDAIAIVSGVFLGSALWWVILSGVAGWLGKRLNDSNLRWINYFSGGIIGLFGLLSIVHALNA